MFSCQLDRLRFNADLVKPSIWRKAKMAKEIECPNCHAVLSISAAETPKAALSVKVVKTAEPPKTDDDDIVAKIVGGE